MADNVTIPATGSGTATPVIATDDVSGVQFQRVKLDAGGDGVTTPILAGTGAAASALRVALADSSAVAATQSGTWNITNISGTVSLPTGAATAAKQPALGTAGTPSSDVISVQGVSGGTALPVSQSGSWAVTVSGTVAISAASLPLPSGASTLAEQQTQTTSLQLLDDAVATTGSATPARGFLAVGTDGANARGLKTDSSGELQIDVLTMPTVTATCAGDVANDAADSGNPVKVGGKAVSALSGVTLVASGDRTNAHADLDGAMLTRGQAAIGDYVSGLAAITDGSSTSVIAAAGSGIKVYVTDVIIANSSATNVIVDLRDGTGGSVKVTLPVPANGGVVHSFGTPIGFSANTAVAADPSAAASTVTVTLSGFKSKV